MDYYYPRFCGCGSFGPCSTIEIIHPWWRERKGECKCIIIVFRTGMRAESPIWKGICLICGFRVAWLTQKPCQTAEAVESCPVRAGTRTKEKGLKDQSSRCWAVRPAEERESPENKPATLGCRKRRAPIFRAVLCDNLLCFSCAEIQKPLFWIDAV